MLAKQIYYDAECLRPVSVIHDAHTSGRRRGRRGKVGLQFFFIDKKHPHDL